MSESSDNMPAVQPGAATSGAAEKALTRRIGIGPQIYMGLFGSVALVSIASFVAYYFLSAIVEHQSRLAVQSIPNLSRAVEVARQSATLVNGAVRMVSATSIDEHEAVSGEVLWEREKLLDVVEELRAGAALDSQVQALESRLSSFGALLEAVYRSSGRRLEIERSLEGLSEELGEVNRRIERAIVAAIDDQGFFLVEGLRSLEDTAQPLGARDWGDELAHYRDLIEISQQANVAGLLMGETLVLTDRDLLGPLEERFQSAAYNLRRVVARLATNSPSGTLVEDAARLVAIGESDDGVFALRRETLDRLRQESEALAAGRAASTELLSDMETLVEEVNSDAVSVNHRHRRTGAADHDQRRRRCPDRLAVRRPAPRAPHGRPCRQHAGHGRGRPRSPGYRLRQ